MLQNREREREIEQGKRIKPFGEKCPRIEGERERETETERER